MVKLSKLLVVNVCEFILFLIQAVTGEWIWIAILGGISTSYCFVTNPSHYRHCPDSFRTIAHILKLEMGESAASKSKIVRNRGLF